MSRGFSHAELSAALEAFAAGHREELTPAERFTLGEAAGIVVAVATTEAVLAAGAAALRRYHPTLAAELDAERAGDRP